MAASGTSAAAIILALLHLAVTGNAVSLDILPSGDVQSKPIGSRFLLTCKPDVSGENIISDMKWLDPLNRTIEPLSAKNAASVNSDMYIEMHNGNSLALYFNSLKEQEAGRYTCVANYASTEPLSKTVMIETIDAINWIDAPVNQYPILGKEYKIKCHVSARPSPTVDWLHGDKLITTNDHYIIETHALKIKKVVESDEGFYTCRASVLTTGELEERKIRVEVLEEPKIEEIGSEIEIVEGRTETITCKASGKPPPKYTWVKYLTREDLSTTDRFGVDKDTGILTITNVNREDDGEYQCIANNTAGETQTLIKVVVIGKPKIMEFVNATTAVGENKEIVCKAFGRPAPQVTFRKHTSLKPYAAGAQLDDDRIILTSIPDNAKGETIAVLSIQNVLRDDDGLYECIATNKVAAAYKNGHLTVEFPPSFALMDNKTVWSWDNRPVNLTCIAESIPNATTTWTYKDQPVDLSRDTYQQIGTGAISTLVIKSIDNRNYGQYKCHAANSHGRREHLIELREAARPGSLQQAKISQITATSVAFELVPPATEEGLPLRDITAQYKEEKEDWAKAKNKTWSVGSPVYVIEDLKPQTYYLFRFSVRNDVGRGNWGTTIHESTPMRNSPNPPTIPKKTPDALYESSAFNNQYQLQWLAPPDNGAPIEMYEIRYCQAKRVGQEWEVFEERCRDMVIKGQRSKEWLRDLNSDTFYKIEVRARNSIGLGNPGVLYIKTARGENSPRLHQGPLISSAAIIGIVIAVLFLIIVVIDVICCCTHKTGIIFYLCERSRKKPVDEEDTKLGREEKEPLKEEKKITPIIDSGLRRETSITFDGKRSVSKTGFVGKDSAV